MDELTKKYNALLEVVEESAHTLKGIEIFINFTDQNTPGRSHALGLIKRYREKVDNVFKK